MPSLQTCELLQSNLTQMTNHLKEIGCAAAIGAETTAGNACDGINGSQYGRPLHIASIFIVFIVSMVGTSLPIIARYVPCLQTFKFAFVIGKCAATGVVLSVSMIHMVGDASEMFNLPCVPKAFSEAYPSYSPLFCVIGAILMHALDLLVSIMISSHMERKSAIEGYMENSTDDATLMAKKLEQEEPIGNELIEVPVGLDDALDNSPVSDHPSETEPAAHNHQHDFESVHGHSHMAGAPREISPVQRTIAAVLMEFGVTSHSVFVGLALGLTEDSKMKGLIIAIVFHQFFEGVALGSRLAEAQFHIFMEFGLAFLFSISAPIGIAAGVGTAIAGSGVSGATYVMLEGIVTAFCGGILLYLAFTLMVVDFPEDMNRSCPPGCSHRNLRRFSLIAAMWIGAAALAAVGKWA